MALGFLQALPLNEGRPLLTLKDVCVVVYGAVKECGEDVGVRGQGCLLRNQKASGEIMVDRQRGGEANSERLPFKVLFPALRTPTVKPWTSQTAHHVPPSPYFVQAHFPAGLKQAEDGVFSRRHAEQRPAFHERQRAAATATTPTTTAAAAATTA